MKRPVTILLSALLAIQAVPVFASGLSAPGHEDSAGFLQSFSVSDTDVASEGGGVPVSGAIPRISGLADEAFQEELNQAFMKLYRDNKAEAEKNEQFDVSFSYERFNYSGETGENIASILIHTETDTETEATTATERVVSFNFDPSACRLLNITDVLGVNAVALVNRVVLEAIRQNPDQYSSDFKGVDESVTFYVEKNGDCVVVFDKSTIGAGYLGVVRFKMKISDVKHYVVEKNDYVVLEDYYSLKMIPMRAVCEGLGYTVGWDKAARAATISKGSFSAAVEPGKNSYAIGTNAPKELESAPKIKDGVIYLPISFFETVLGAAYSLDSDENVAFSQYSPKQA